MNKSKKQLENMQKENDEIKQMLKELMAKIVIFFKKKK